MSDFRVGDHIQFSSDDSHCLGWKQGVIEQVDHDGGMLLIRTGDDVYVSRPRYRCRKLCQCHKVKL